VADYAVNPRKVVHQTIDDETIIIHFDTGNYYSLTGAEIWQLVANGYPTAEIPRRLGQLYDADTEALKSGVEQLVGELAAEDLIEPSFARRADLQP
jgi:hypothetical protein